MIPMQPTSSKTGSRRPIPRSQPLCCTCPRAPTRLSPLAPMALPEPVWWKSSIYRKDSMKHSFTSLAIAMLWAAPFVNAGASQADSTTITIVGNTPGVTPFISQVTLNASDTTTLKAIQFTIAPKTGSVTRPLSGNYSRSYLIQRGFLQAGSGDIHLPVYGLYSAFSNTVTLKYYFNDGSSSQAGTTITTASFVH